MVCTTFISLVPRSTLASCAIGRLMAQGVESGDGNVTLCRCTYSQARIFLSISALFY